MQVKATKQYYTKERFLFYCNIKIKLPVEAGPNIINQCFEILENVDITYNSHSSGSFFHQINHTSNQWVEVDEETVWMLEKILKITKLTDGAYNIGAMPLLKIWGFYDDDKNVIPTNETIMLATQNINKGQIEINGNKVRITHNTELITGSFIKAYAVDKAIHFLRSKGVTDAIINAGGSTIYGLNDNEHPYWNINIPHPNEKNSTWMQLQLSNACFSLSGNVQHTLTINGKRYGHIINANTGFPSSALQSGALTKSAFLGDVLTTALLANNGSNDFEEHIKKQYKNDLIAFYLVNEKNKHNKPQFIKL